jgi:hypothetical protein
MMACESGDCTHRFCTYCLAVHLGINIDLSAGKGDGWACPTCSSKCCCSQPECNKAHRHCKAYRYRCRRAAAASLRMSAAHALVSLGVSPSPNQPKHTTNPDPTALAADGLDGRAAGGKMREDSGKKALDSSSRRSRQQQQQQQVGAHEQGPPCKRRESPQPLGPSEGGDEEGDEVVGQIGGASEDNDGGMRGEAAVSVLVSLGGGGGLEWGRKDTEEDEEEDEGDEGVGKGEEMQQGREDKAQKDDKMEMEMETEEVLGQQQQQQHKRQRRDKKEQEQATDERSATGRDGGDKAGGEMTGSRLEQLAFFALQSLADVAAGGGVGGADKGPGACDTSAPQGCDGSSSFTPSSPSSVSEDAMSRLDTPRLPNDVPRGCWSSNLNKTKGKLPHKLANKACSDKSWSGNMSIEQLMSR